MTWLIWAGAFVAVIFGLTALTGAPYVPSHRKSLKKAFSKLRPLTKGDLVVDIGSGDGAVLKEVAASRGRAHGIEINPILVVISKIRTMRYGGLVTTQLGNFWRTEFPNDTTVVYTFGESRDIEKMYEKVQKEATRLNRSLDFISYGFSVKGQSATKEKYGFYMYSVKPLQSDNA